MKTRVHKYSAGLEWTGASQGAAADYTTYRREFSVRVSGKPDLSGSADPQFRGDPAVHNPEDWMLASVAACHMLTYLALCVRRGVVVMRYRDEPQGVVEFDAAGVGRFTEVMLQPTVVVSSSEMQGLALHLHEQANRTCVIANSCRFPIHHRPEIRIEERR